MLKQNINLYHPGHPPKPNNAYFTFKQFCISIGTILSIFLVMYVNLFIQDLLQAREKNRLQQETMRLQAQFYELKNKYPALFFSHDVEQSLALIQKNIAIDKKFLNEFIADVSFSKSLLGLAYASIPEVWLTTITISNTEDAIALKGNAQHAASLQQWIANLSQQEIFSDYGINVNQIENFKSPSGTLTFEVTMVKKPHE